MIRLPLYWSHTHRTVLVTVLAISKPIALLFDDEYGVI